MFKLRVTESPIMPIFKNSIFSMFLKENGEHNFSLTTTYERGENEYHLTTDYIISQDNWYHVGLVMDSSHNLLAYINGLEIGYVALGGAPALITGDILIGANGSSEGSDYFKGKIDEVRFSRTPSLSFPGSPGWHNLSEVAVLDDGTKIMKSDFDDDNFDRLYVWSPEADYSDSDSDTGSSEKKEDSSPDTPLGGPAGQH